MAESVIKPPGRLHLGLSEVLHFKELFFFFVWRDVKVKYKQTVLGLAWAILQPVLMTVMFTFLFASKFGSESGELPYTLYVFSGFIIWNLFAAGITGASGSILSNASIIRKIYFPRLIIPFSAILVALFDFTMTLLPFVVLLIYHQIHFQVINMIVLMLASVVITLITAIGTGTFLSALTVKYRDFRYVIPFAVQALMFATPVFYSAEMIKGYWYELFSVLNPIIPAIEIFRSGFTSHPIAITTIIVPLTVSVIYMVGGVIFFKKVEYQFADIA
ncbi:MAG TPA: ABC transporter permease [Bacteroidia bacterium]|nr:ABC transporter permease [Bacteroidia bacterium]